MTYVLIPGAGCTSWHWHPFTAELERRGHRVIAPDLPCDDPDAGLTKYADTVVDAVGQADEVVVVAHSLGGFTAALTCERLPVRELVLVAAMIPRPGERAHEWWDNTGYEWVDSEADTSSTTCRPPSPRRLASSSGTRRTGRWMSPVPSRAGPTCRSGP